MDIGLHCSVGACSQVDFLPFTCDCCRSVFCLEHRTYDAHECPMAGSKDRRVIDCPLCGNLLHWTTEQDVNAVWERHVQGGACVPKNGTRTSIGKPKKPKKPRCSADGCRDVLTASNQFQCTKCHQSVCLKHRFESDHDCETVRRSQQRQWGLPRRPNGAANAQQNAKKGAATVVSGTKSAVNSLVQNAKAAGAAVSAVTTASEECPLCHKKFAYVSQLIAHVNKAHPDTAATRSAPSTAATAGRTATTGSSSGGREVCPQCRAEFRDLDALIQHAESAHAGAMAAAASAGGRPAGRTSDSDKCLLM